MATYQGGKQKLGKKIKNRILELERKFVGRTLPYLEPFVGFCGVLQHFNGEHRLLSACDSNEDIIALWRQLQEGWTPPVMCSKNRYEELKLSTSHTAERGFISFACSYGGIYFSGYRPNRSYSGKTVNYLEISSRKLVQVAQKVKQVDFLPSTDYWNLNPQNMLVYCDPPYKGNVFREPFFKNFDSDKFWHIMREWSKNNFVVISERSAPEDFIIVWEDVCTTGHAGSQNTQKEYLFIHKNLNVVKTYP